MDIIVVWCHNIRHKVAMYPNPMAEPWAHTRRKDTQKAKKKYIFSLPFIAIIGLVFWK